MEGRCKEGVCCLVFFIRSFIPLKSRLGDSYEDVCLSIFMWRERKSLSCTRFALCRVSDAGIHLGKTGRGYRVFLLSSHFLLFILSFIHCVVLLISSFI